VELAGSGTAGTAPAYGSILKACGFSETIVASTSVTYAPVSSSFSSVTIYYNVDGVRHKLTGCRGTFTLNGTVGDIPYIEFHDDRDLQCPTDHTALAGRDLQQPSCAAGLQERQHQQLPTAELCRLPAVD
jgi:hypothetical protein